MTHPRNVYEHLEQIRERLEMYIGDRDILNLEQYLTGYTAALHLNGIEEPGDSPRFAQFFGWLCSTHGNRGWSCGWARGLLEREGSNEEALERFFELAAEFGRLHVVPGEFLDLPSGSERTGVFLALNRNPREMPDRLQLVRLLPGDSAFLRSWYGDRPQDSSVRATVESVHWYVEWEYGISPEAFGITLPEPAGRGAELKERWERHRVAMEALHQRRGKQ